ncbi:MAG: RNA polymerase sigma factor (sigma-70 family) [Crocinitomix sp.]|jgi:RNA polymerase sigma factor (sigma-70 family)
MLFSALFRKNISSYSDLDLIDLVKKRNGNAEGEIFKRYSALVMGLCLKYMKNQMVAEDMSMEIFESLPEKIRRSEIQNFKNWLFSVARNSCLMELRKKKKDTAEIDQALIYAADDSEAILQSTIAKEEELVELEAKLATLKTEQKRALTHFYLESKSYDQVSALMEIPAKAVKSLIQNGKRNLKLKLEQNK